MLTPLRIRSSASDARCTRTALVDIGALYESHRVLLEQAIASGLSLALLEAALLQRSLDRSATEGGLTDDFIHSHVNPHAAPFPTLRQMVFMRRLYELFEQIWTTSPYADGSRMVYHADRRGYHASTIAVEVTFRHASPPS